MPEKTADLLVSILEKAGALEVVETEMQKLDPAFRLAESGYSIGPVYFTKHLDGYRWKVGDAFFVPASALRFTPKVQEGEQHATVYYCVIIPPFKDGRPFLVVPLGIVPSTILREVNKRLKKEKESFGKTVKIRRLSGAEWRFDETSPVIVKVKFEEKKQRGGKGTYIAATYRNKTVTPKRLPRGRTLDVPLGTKVSVRVEERLNSIVAVEVIDQRLRGIMAAMPTASVAGTGRIRLDLEAYAVLGVEEGVSASDLLEAAKQLRKKKYANQEEFNTDHIVQMMLTGGRTPKFDYSPDLEERKGYIERARKYLLRKVRDDEFEAVKAAKIARDKEKEEGGFKSEEESSDDGSTASSEPAESENDPAAEASPEAEGA